MNSPLSFFWHKRPDCESCRKRLLCHIGKSDNRQFFIFREKKLHLLNIFEEIGDYTPQNSFAASLSLCIYWSITSHVTDPSNLAFLRRLWKVGGVAECSHSLGTTSWLLKEAKFFFGRLPLLETTISSLSSARCAPFWWKISGVTGQF